MSTELAWRLATGMDAKTKEILENCVILIFPSANPDGLDKVRDWYLKGIGKPWEVVSWLRLLGPYSPLSVVGVIHYLIAPSYGDLGALTAL